jgi:exonuclease III
MATGRSIKAGGNTAYPTLEGCEIDKGARAQEKPSDHTPIIVTLR